MFNIGDKIVYPMHGAGTIVSIEEKEILGDLRSYYVLLMPVGDMKVMVPIDSVKEIGLREIIAEEDLKNVMGILSKEVSSMSDNWNKRYRENLEKIKSGDICEVALVVKDLNCREVEKGLSTGERKMLNNAKQILMSEIALVKEINSKEVEKLMSKFL